VPIAERRPADVNHHRAMTGHQRGEGQLASLILVAAPRGEPLRQFGVAQRGRGPVPEQVR
jgi:hypothetical protein